MILIVEDHPENAELFRIFIERKAGLKAHICTRGDDILRLCQTGTVKLVIMDIQLHETFHEGRPVTGIDLSLLLKSDPKTRPIPIIIATAHAMKDQLEHFLRDSGADACFTKPVEDFDPLLADIRRLLSTSHSKSFS